MDVQGPELAKTYYEKHKVTYPAWVDPGNALGDAIGFKVVPNLFYVDEFGVFRGQLNRKRLQAAMAKNSSDTSDAGQAGDDPTSRFLAEVGKPVASTLTDDDAQRLREAVPTAAVADLCARADANLHDLDALLAAGRACLRAGDLPKAVVYLGRAFKLDRGSSEAAMLMASAYLSDRNKADAAAVLRRALEADPDNFLIRKQIWAIEHAARFYSDEKVDFAWQERQLAAERGHGGT